MEQVLRIFVEYVFAYFYQSILFVSGIHIFSNHNIKWKPFFICTIISMITTILARALLTFGNHTLFSLIILILLSIALLKIPAQKVVKSALLITILMFIFEGVIIFLFKITIENNSFDKFMKNDGKIVTGILSNILFTITLILIYYIKKRKKVKELKGE